MRKYFCAINIELDVKLINQEFKSEISVQRVDRLFIEEY